jgi:hypothetical protein
MRRFALLLLLIASPGPSDAEDVTVYRCVAANGRVSLQDQPCAAGQAQTTRQMQRPQDAPAPPAPPPAPAVQAPQPPPMLVLPPPRRPPPELYQCTSYDGIQRISEVYDPNPRCEPIVLYYRRPERLPPRYASACRWVEDSCRRMGEQEACTHWRRRQQEARSAALHAFSDTAAYRRSELARITQIVEESCR